MCSSQTRALLVACLAGSAVAGDAQEPMLAEVQAGELRHVAHIYYNVGTGERLTTLIDGADNVYEPLSEGGNEIWVSSVPNGCGLGEDEFLYYAVTSITSFTGAYTHSPGDYLFDWGDIQTNTVVDCVQVHWMSDFQDTDLDSDGVGDGVVGFAARWIFWDGMNGRAPQFNSIAEPIISFMIHTLPGKISDPEDSSLAYYTMDVDLAADFGSSLIFEIGDTDSDLQGASFHNPRMDLRDNEYIDSMTIGDGIPDVDPDEDGLADWGWSIQYYLPGEFDVDNADGDFNPSTGVDGVTPPNLKTGVRLGVPQPSEPFYNPDTGQWELIALGFTAGATEDAYNTGHEDQVTGGIILDGPWWFGGFSCDSHSHPELNNTPFSGFQITLYSGVADYICPAGDLNLDGYQDFLDIQIFVTELPDLNGDGAFDFLDIQVFSRAFLEGCIGSE